MKYLNLAQIEGVDEHDDIIQYESSLLPGGRIFPGGEIFFRLNCAECHSDDGIVFILCRLTSSDAIMELFMAVDALRRQGYDKLFLSMYYMPYAQQDRVCSPGESLSVKVFADLINSLGFEEVTIYDPHSDVGPALLNNVSIIENTNLVGEALKPFPRVNLLVPDAGAQKKIFKVLRSHEIRHEINLVLCSKVRELSTNKIVATVVPFINNDWPCVLVDDICLAGGTFVGIVKEMRAQGNQNPVRLCVSHGIFNEGFDLLRQYFCDIITTESRPKRSDEAGFVTRVTV